MDEYDWHLCILPDDGEGSAFGSRLAFVGGAFWRLWLSTRRCTVCHGGSPSALRPRQGGTRTRGGADAKRRRRRSPRERLWGVSIEAPQCLSGPRRATTPGTRRPACRTGATRESDDFSITPTVLEYQTQRPNSITKTLRGRDHAKFDLSSMRNLKFRL